jgi:hypothetical protein
MKPRAHLHIFFYADVADVLWGGALAVVKPIAHTHIFLYDVIVDGP